MEFAPDENMSDRVFVQMNEMVKQMSKMGKGRMEELETRRKMESSFFAKVQSSGWDVEYREGRISGSLAWKVVRSELREHNYEKKGESKDEGKDTSAHSSLVERIYPSSRDSDIVIVVQPPSSSHFPSAAYKSYP